MLKKIIFGVICAATLTSLVAWRIDWQKNKSEIELINYEHEWIEYLEETEGNVIYDYPEMEYGLNGIDGHFEINITKYGHGIIVQPYGDEVLICDVHYNWLGQRTYERTYRM